MMRMTMVTMPLGSRGRVVLRLLALLLSLGPLRATSFDPHPTPSLPRNRVSRRQRFPRNLVRGGGTTLRSGQPPASSNDLDDTDATNQQDFSSPASNIFGNIRIPAALFAGASAGSAYALPLLHGDGLQVGFAKRLYALLMIHTLAAQTTVILVATVAMTGCMVANQKPPGRQAASLVEWMLAYFPAEWITIKYQFIAGIGTFVLANVLRAWITVICPVLSWGCVGALLSSLLLALAFVDQTEKSMGGGSLISLPWQQCQVLFQSTRQSPLFALAVLSYFVTMVYILVKIPHLYHYLSLASAGGGTTTCTA